MVIAFGSYPKGHRFESHHRHHLLWPHGQAVKTSPFHGGIRSSILLGVTTTKTNPDKQEISFYNKYNIYLARKIKNGSLAQLGEHLPYKQRVIGSSPIVSTNMACWSSG